MPRWDADTEVLKSLLRCCWSGGESVLALNLQCCSLALESSMAADQRDYSKGRSATMFSMSRVVVALAAVAVLGGAPDAHLLRPTLAAPLDQELPIWPVTVFDSSDLPGTD